jgi:hypothetical protein
VGWRTERDAALEDVGAALAVEQHVEGGAVAVADLHGRVGEGARVGRLYLGAKGPQLGIAPAADQPRTGHSLLNNRMYGSDIRIGEGAIK